MRRLIIRRLLISVPLVLLVSFVTFALEALAPGDAARTILGENYTPASYRQLRRQLGLDQPLLDQYWHWLVSALHGDLGTSPISGLSVTNQIMDRIGVTASLVAGTVLIASAIGLALGVASAVRGGPLGRAVDVLSLIGFALPAFWFALILVTVFAVTLRLFPATGYTPFTSSPAAWLRSLVLPVIALAVHPIAVVAKQTRDGMLDALGRDFVHSLRANGISETSIVFRHALRNAAIPVVTVISMIFLGLLNGTVLVETVFAMPGIGGLAVQSTNLHDVPVLQGVVVTFTLAVVATNLLVDVAYGWLNPKARVQ